MSNPQINLAAYSSPGLPHLGLRALWAAESLKRNMWSETPESYLLMASSALSSAHSKIKVPQILQGTKITKKSKRGIEDTSISSGCASLG